MTKQRQSRQSLRLLWLIPAGLLILGFVIAMLLKDSNITVLNPRGQIATLESQLMIRAIIIMLEIAIPSLTLFYYIAWKYRETNQKTTQNTTTPHNKSLVLAIWVTPTITMLLLAVNTRTYWTMPCFCPESGI